MTFNARHVLPGLAAAGALLAATSFLAIGLTSTAQAQQQRPNILVIFGDDIGLTNVSAYSFGLMKDFPPRQKPSSFSIDDIMETLKKPQGG